MDEPTHDPRPMTASGYVDVADLWRRLRSRWLLAVVVFVLVVGAMAAYLLVRPRSYRATARVQVSPFLTQLTSTYPISPLAFQPNISEEAQVVQSAAVAELVRPRIGNRLPVTTLEDNVNAQPVAGTTVMSISYSARAAGFAAEVANAYAGAYLARRAGIARRAMDAAASSTQTQLNTVIGRIETASARLKGATGQRKLRVSTLIAALQQNANTLQARIADLKANVGIVKGGVLLTSARGSTAVPSPSRIKYGLVGVIAGLALGILAAVAIPARERRRRRTWRPWRRRAEEPQVQPEPEPVSSKT